MPKASKHRDEVLPAELYHYTNWSGLRGIIETQSLWATRYNHLNDATEVEHFRDLITDALADKIKPILREIRGSKFRSRRAFDKAGGLLAIARNNAQALVDSIYQASFTGRPGGMPFAVPYITSFCSHANDHAYERANGLLSQWRGYGSESNGRYAIVFDRGRLLSLLKRESDHFDYPHLQMCKVVYNTNPLAEDFSSMFSSIVDTLSEVLRKHITEEDSAVAAMGNVLMDFLSATTRFKHRG
ncbi:MAG: hypothetical protein AMXMBFR74_17460, partial [Parvibaculum sp.]|uniref:DUF2971 domain-containing protein n=1 Tax=Parvibaculum sp. TaxID=2024848 RepID=UPI0035BB35CD